MGRGGGGEVRRLGRTGAGRAFFPRGRYSVVREMRGLDDLIVVRSLGSRGFLWAREERVLGVEVSADEVGPSGSGWVTRVC